MAGQMRGLLSSVVRFLLQGHLPNHIAFIMDGNRRFADRESMDKIGGHKEGYRKMVDIIQWCLQLGIKHVSVYAFSIDNFKRSESEVADLMALVAVKCKELMRDDSARSWKTELRVVGDLELAPGSVQTSAAQLILSSRSEGHHSIVNICFCYRGTEELGHAVRVLQSVLQEMQLLPTDVSPELLSRCCFTREVPPVNVLVRTSGETRLSDFLPWQMQFAHLQWLPCFWPDLTYLDLLRCCMEWQRAAPTLQQLKGLAGADAEEGGSTAENSSAAGAWSWGSGLWHGWSFWGSSRRPDGVLEQAISSSLSVISEEEQCCCPHPSQKLRVEGFLQKLSAADQAWLEAKSGWKLGGSKT